MKGERIRVRARDLRLGDIYPPDCGVVVGMTTTAYGSLVVHYQIPGGSNYFVDYEPDQLEEIERPSPQVI